MSKDLLKLITISKKESSLVHDMSIHYSQPKGFVGRSICYAVEHNGVRYGSIVGGSATLHLVGRNDFFPNIPLNSIVNNIFFHIYKVNNEYPFRNFTSYVVKRWRYQIAQDWYAKYGDTVLGFETLVELPRTGELYIRDGWTNVGQTVGYTCKRVAGKGTDSWSGKRVWDTENLRPKLVFCRHR